MYSVYSKSFATWALNDSSDLAVAISSAVVVSSPARIFNMLNVGSIYTVEDIKIIDKIRPNKVLDWTGKY
jgi:hypothetical protein